MAFTSFRGRVPGPSLGGAATPSHTAILEKAAADLAQKFRDPALPTQSDRRAMIGGVEGAGLREGRGHEGGEVPEGFRGLGAANNKFHV